MKKLNVNYINLSLIILFTAVLLRKFIELPDFIYGLSIGISITLSLVCFTNLRKNRLKLKINS